MTKENNNFFPSIMQTIYLLILFLLSFIVITVIQKVLSEGVSDTPLFILCRTLGAASITIVFAFLISKRNIKFFTLPFKKVDIRICLWMLPIGLLFFFFMWGMVLLIFIFFPDSNLNLPTSTQVHIYTFISIVCVTPLFEELLFRGIILDGFLQRYSLFKAMFLSVIFFTLLHAGFQMLTATFLGILTGYIYYVTKSVWPGVILHGMNNLCAFLGLYLVRYISPDTSSDIQPTEEIIFTIGVLWIVITIVFLSILYHLFLLLKSKYNCSII